MQRLVKCIKDSLFEWRGAFGHVFLGCVFGWVVFFSWRVFILWFLVDEGVLDYDERTGKGGYHRVYRPKLDESSFKRYVVQVMVSSLMRDYPEETKEVIKSTQKRRLF